MESNRPDESKKLKNLAEALYVEQQKTASLPRASDQDIFRAMLGKPLASQPVPVRKAG